ncbi:ribonuclease E activity regulator RraA [Kocuria salsicia]|uniref:ribonuclease E activity regulator RraA n=1 Tax=Kocuria salsicia TaxID=664639 RepID=UPI0011A76DE7|nr:ribonuclease E activity regulator RraA [Kocuria salsicia]
MSISTCDLYDERGDELQSVTTQFISVGGVHQFTGPIRTVRCFESNVDAKKLVATPGDGAVLVVDGQGSMNCALLGDNVARTAMENGWAGLVINAPVRDRVELGTLQIGVKALGTNPRKSSPNDFGETDVILNFGGVTFRPGKTLWADEDGILVER